MSAIHPKVILAAGGLAAAAALGTALAAQWYGGLVPCALCLVERWPYRIAIAVAVLGLLLPARLSRGVVALLLLTGLAAAAAAAVHVGVERKLWASPLPECAAPRITGTTPAELLAHMPSGPSKSCEDPVYAIDAVPLSFAEMNLIFALAFSAGLATWLATSRGSPA